MPRTIFNNIDNLVTTDLDLNSLSINGVEIVSTDRVLQNIESLTVTNEAYANTLRYNALIMNSNPLVYEDYSILTNTSLVNVNNFRYLPLTITLPDATLCEGQIVNIRDYLGLCDTIYVKIITTDNQTINGELSYNLTYAYQNIQFLSEYGNWVILSGISTLQYYYPKNVCSNVITQTTSSTTSYNSAISMSADGSLIAVGCPGDASGKGAVYLFKKTGSTYSEYTKIIPSDSTSTSAVGTSVALSSDGKALVIGGPGTSTLGAFWIYKIVSGTWTVEGSKLVPNDAIGTANVGSSVAITMVTDVENEANYHVYVGGRTSSTNVGAVWYYIYSIGSPAVKIIKKTVTSGLSVGTSVDASFYNNRAEFNIDFVVYSNLSTTNPGIYLYNPSGNVTLGPYFPVDCDSTANVGYSVSIDKDTIAFGAPNNDSNNGGIWVYTYDGADWNVQGSKLIPSEISSSALSFGGLVKIKGDTIAASSLLSACDIWLYTRSGTTWTKTKRFNAAIDGVNSFALSASGNIMSALAYTDSSFNSNGHAIVLSNTATEYKSFITMIAGGDQTNSGTSVQKITFNTYRFSPSNLNISKVNGSSTDFICLTTGNYNISFNASFSETGVTAGRMQVELICIAGSTSITCYTSQPDSTIAAVEYSNISFNQTIKITEGDVVYFTFRPITVAGIILKSVSNGSITLV